MKNCQIVVTMNSTSVTRQEGRCAYNTAYSTHDSSAPKVVNQIKNRK